MEERELWGEGGWKGWEDWEEGWEWSSEGGWKRGWERGDLGGVFIVRWWGLGFFEGGGF